MEYKYLITWIKKRLLGQIYWEGHYSSESSRAQTQYITCMPTWQRHEPCHPFVVSLKPTHLCAVLPPFLSRFTPSLSNSLSLSLGFPSRSSLSTYYTNPHFRFRFCLSRFKTLCVCFFWKFCC